MATFKWTVEFEIDEIWVADGFDLDNDRANEMIQETLGWATSSEVKAKVLKSPDPKAIKKAQGYDDDPEDQFANYPDVRHNPGVPI